MVSKPGLRLTIGTITAPWAVQRHGRRAELSVIRVINVYFPTRTLVLLAGEALVVWTSFVLAILVQHREDSYVLLNYEGGYVKILVTTIVVLIFSHWFDLYDPEQFNANGEVYFRLL